MTDATRYKTIATIAVAFSLGNLFATACGGGGEGGGLFKNAAANTAALEADVAALRQRVNALEQTEASLYCFIGAMTDDQAWASLELDHDDAPGFFYEIEWTDTSQVDGEAPWGQGPNSDSAKAYANCF